MMNDPNRQVVMTTTNELFLPSRIIYRVIDRARVLAIFRGLRCMVLEPSGRWTWNYEFEAKKMDFPPEYDQVPREHQPLVLASCYWVAPDGLHVYVRSTLRLRKFLEFFDQVPRSCAQGEFFDEYTLLSTRVSGASVPTPEDLFRDDNKIAVGDFEGQVSGPTLAAELRRTAEKTLEPLERHRLTAFYEDGPEHMLHAMELREILAMEQYRSAEPIRPLDVLRRVLERSNAPPAGDSEGDTSVPKKPSHNAGRNVERLASATLGTESFSFLKHDPALNRDIVEMNSPSGTRERFVATFGCCDNPGCDCQVLELWLASLDDPGRPGRRHHLQLHTETRQVRCALPTESLDQTLAQELAGRLTPADWALADHCYRSDKADHSEPMDARNLAADFPEDVLTDPSQMLEYQDVFPHARYIQFEAAGKSWLVLEHYCSNPDCECQDVYLDLAQVPNAASGKVAINDVAGIICNYGTATVKLRKAAPPGCPPISDLMAALEAADPELKLRLQRRQRVLRQLHRKANHARRSNAHPLRAAKKVGRNEPCTCGSGKKFKKCCGR
jgi:hypothetical protein